MTYAVRFTVTKSSQQRCHGKFTYLQRDINGCRVGFYVGVGANTLVDKQNATRFATLDEAREALCKWIMLGAFGSRMWVKNPRIVQID